MKPVTTFAVGPSQIYFTVENHIRQAFRDGIPSISHRSKEFENIFAQTTESLRTLLNIPSDYYLFFTASATEVWERAVQNLVNETSFHFVNGSFSQKFFETSKQLGKKAMAMEVELGKGFASTDVPEEMELIALIANETSTGVTTGNDFVATVRQQNPNALLITDAVSAVPYQQIDFSLIDSCFFSVQKGFGLPAGLGVWIVNGRCIEKAEKLKADGKSIGTYHSIPSYVSFAQKNQTPETPNVLGIYLLGKVAEDFLRRGIDVIRKETEYKSAILYHALENHSIFKPSVTQKEWRSKTTIVANTGTLTEKLTQYLEPHGLIPGDGYGPGKKTQLRFANFPAQSKEVYEKLVDLIQAFE
jgi:phosphoserine aminotransferase